MKYNHMFDVAFSIESNNSEESVNIDEIINGLEKRLDFLRKERDIEAFGLVDSYEN
mgnify:FL=1|jgi:hypothetical protein